MTSIPEEYAVLLVGSGAVDNAWQPVRRALLTIHSGQVLAPGTENLAFANIVFQLRWLHRNRWATNLWTLLKVRTLYRLNCLLQNKRLNIITTNWDLALEAQNDAIGLKVEVTHIHGSAANPKTLYLPSEMTQEPYRCQPSLNLTKLAHW
jgi:hypothetical protein